MKKRTMLLSDIDKENFGIAVPKEVVDITLSFAEEYDAKGMMIVHSETDELIAGIEEYEAALERGDEYVEVIDWNIPENLIFGAKLLKCGKGLSYQEGSVFAKKAMKYFSFKANGDGVKLRKILDPEDSSLPDFVAKLFNTNRTTLYSWLKVADQKPELLKFVDSGKVTMGDAERVVNQRSSRVTPERSDSKQEEKSTPEKRRFVNHDEITHHSQLTPSELSLATDKLPEFLTQLRKLDIIPNDILVERIYQHIPNKGAKKGTEKSAPKVDHLSIALNLSNFEVLITIHEMDNNQATDVALEFPEIEEVDDQFAIAA